MNLVYYRKGSNEISGVILDCVKSGNWYEGSWPEGRRTLKPEHYDFVWTEDLIEYVYDTGGNITGWSKNIQDIIPSQDSIECKKTTYQDYVAALKVKKILDNMNYNDIELYINNNIIDLATAKDFLIKLSKFVLALAKIVDREV